jgi:predicted RNase H-like HicB family nuclease
MFKYSVRLIWSDADESYVARIPEFPGLSAFGDTPEEALAEARIAAEAFIEDMQEDDEVLPEHKVLQEYGGKIHLRLPRSLHGKLVQDAEDDGVSLNQHILHLLSGRSAEIKTIKSFQEHILSMQNQVMSVYIGSRDRIDEKYKQPIITETSGMWHEMPEKLKQ